VCPFNDTLFKVGSNISGTDFISAFGDPKNASSSLFFAELPEMIVAGDVIPDEYYEVYTVDYDLPYVKEQLEEVSDIAIELEPIELPESTRTLMAKYIDNNNEWQCPEEPEEEEEQSWQQKFIDFFENFTVVKIIAFIMTFFVIIFFGWMFLCRHPHQRLTDEDSVVDEDSYGENSGIDFSTCSDEDGSLFPVSAKTPPSGLSGLNGSRSYQTISGDNLIV
jgi:hypothetical protein